MPLWGRRAIVIGGALAITLVMFGFWYLVVNLLPRPQPEIIHAEIYRTKPAP